MEDKKKKFVKDIKQAIKQQKFLPTPHIDICIVDKKNITKEENYYKYKIGIKDNTIDFELDFKKENIFADEDKKYSINLYFENTIFTQSVSFRNVL